MAMGRGMLRLEDLFAEIWQSCVTAKSFPPCCWLQKGRQEIPEGAFGGMELHSVCSLGGWCVSDSLNFAWRVALGKNGVPDKI